MGKPLGPKNSRWNGDADFILTISSDDELDIPDLDGEDADINPDINSSEPKKSLKRKRQSSLQVDKQSSGTGIDHETSKFVSSSRSPLVNLRVGNGEPSAVDTDGHAQAQDDEAFDPDFEFGLLQEGFRDNFGTQAMWTAFDSNSSKADRDADAMVLDRIIQKRKVQKQQALESQQNESENVDETMNGFAGLSEDEEFLAEDGFGMGNIPDGLGATNKMDSQEMGRKPVANGDSDFKDHNESDSEGGEDGIAVSVPHPDDKSSNESDADDEMRRRQADFYEPQPYSAAANPSFAPLTSFQEMALSRPILKGVTAIGFTAPTPIQTKTVPVALQGKDLVGGAVTGSGKTAAFMIPILERLLYRPKKVPTTRVAILMPTRELAVQCFNVGTKLASFTDVSFALLVGGLSLREQEQTLRKRPDIIVATPGRFIDHMRNSASFALESIEILVLDEADRMLEDGFADELNEVLTTIPRSRQTMLFSATMTEDVDQLIRVGLNKPVRLIVDEREKTVKELTQEFIKMKSGKGQVDENRRLAYLLHLCATVYTSKTIIFFPRKTLAHRVKVLFALQGIKAAELHGSMSQEQRLQSISSFQEGLSTHLLATDLASRGLDIPKVETVINFTVPTTPTTYLHRVGRTARAGQSGVSCTLFASASREKSSSASERSLLRPILRLARDQQAKLQTRSFPNDLINILAEEVLSSSDEIESILKEEKEARLLQQTDRDIQKGENLIRYQNEIASRPRRTWFQSEKQKQTSRNLGKLERMGISSQEASQTRNKAPKTKLSGKDRKRLQNRDARSEGHSQGWKKGRDARGRTANSASKRDKMKVKKQKEAIAKSPNPKKH